MRIQNDRGLFISDGVHKQFRFIVSRNTASELMTAFMMKRHLFKNLEIDYDATAQDAKRYDPADMRSDNPKVTFVVNMMDEWYDILLKAMYDKSRYDTAAGIAFEFNKN